MNHLSDLSRVVLSAPPGRAASANAELTFLTFMTETETFSVPAAGSMAETLCSGTVRRPKPTLGRQEQTAEVTRGIRRTA